MVWSVRNGPLDTLRPTRHSAGSGRAWLRSSDGIPGLARRLDELFTAVEKPDGGLWTMEQAAAEITRSGTPITPAYFSQLRAGKRDNPSARHLAAIAQHFGVPITYFFDDQLTDKLRADLHLLSAIRDSGAIGLLTRAHGLSRESLASLEGIIDQVRRLEHLPEHAEAFGIKPVDDKELAAPEQDPGTP